MVYDSNNNEYTVTDGVLYITKGARGTGVMPTFTSSYTVRTLVGEDFTSVVMDSTMTNVGYNAFNGVVTLIDITMPSVTTIGNSSFKDCNNLAITSLPSGVTYIGDYAFYNCTSLALTSLPSGVTYIGNTAFAYCTSLALTSLPISTITISNYAFYGCTSLATLIVQSNADIGNSAFNRCTNLASITMQSSTPATVGTSAFPTTTTIYVPHGSLSAYQTAWSAYANQIVELPNPKIKYAIVRGASRLPSGYKEVEYIQSSGSQHIDTGIALNTIGKQEFGLMRVSSDSRGLMGANGTSPNYFGWNVYNCYEFNQTSTSVVASNTSFDDVEWNMTTKTLSVNGTVLITASNNFANANMTLFSINGGHSMSAKMSYVRLYDTSNVLIGDYVPCIRTSDNAVGMYDLVSNTFKANAGSGTFTAGPVVKTVRKYAIVRGASRLPTGYTEVEYIESSGTQWIDTGIIGHNDTAIELRAKITTMRGSIFGSRSSAGANNISCFITDSFYIDFNNSSYDPYRISGNNPDADVLIECNRNYRRAINMSTGAVIRENTTLNSDTITTPGNIYLANTSGNPYASEKAIMKVYLFKIKSDSILVRDLVPCISPTNAVGMYDLVTNQFFANSATSGADFIAGPVVSRTKLYRLIRG